jgi:hypothetical protein
LTEIFRQPSPPRSGLARFADCIVPEAFNRRHLVLRNGPQHVPVDDLMLAIRWHVPVVKERHAEGETDANDHTEEHTHDIIQAFYAIVVC